MKEENVKYLKNYEPEMGMALWGRYVRNIPQSILKEVARIYKEETGKDIDVNYSCGNCILNLMTRTAKIYYKANPERIPEGHKL